MENKYYLIPNPGLVLERHTRYQLDCPYCHIGKPLVDDNVSYVAVEHSAGLLWFNSDKFVGDNETEFVHISYCPMCGRQLDDRDV